MIHGQRHLAAPVTSNADRRAPVRSIKPLRLLILGGTRFIGIHMTEIARRHGHALTLFNRGRTNRDLFPDVETLQLEESAPGYTQEVTATVKYSNGYNRWYLHLPRLSLYCASDACDDFVFFDPENEAIELDRRTTI